VCSTHLILLDLITIIIFGEVKSTNYGTNCAVFSIILLFLVV
jgi:hypothetical protein